MGGVVRPGTGQPAGGQAGAPYGTAFKTHGSAHERPSRTANITSNNAAHAAGQTRRTCPSAKVGPLCK